MRGGLGTGFSIAGTLRKRGTGSNRKKEVARSGSSDIIYKRYTEEKTEVMRQGRRARRGRVNDVRSHLLWLVRKLVTTPADCLDCLHVPYLTV